jgi:hypothetical protein
MLNGGGSSGIDKGQEIIIRPSFASDAPGDSAPISCVGNGCAPRQGSGASPSKLSADRNACVLPSHSLH